MPLHAVTTPQRKYALSAIGLGIVLTSILAGCATVPTEPETQRFFPQIAGAGESLDCSQNRWAFARVGEMAKTKATLLSSDGNLVAYVDVRNVNSERPLIISNAFASDKTDTLLKIDQSEQISRGLEGDSAELRQKANMAAGNSVAALHDAGIYNAIGARPAWAASLGEGVASAITSSLLGSEATSIKERARYIRENVFQNRPIPKGYADRGLIFFIRGDRVQPYTLHLDLYNGEKTESFAFAFRRPSFEDVVSCVPEAVGERASYMNTFSVDERNMFVHRAAAIISDPKTRVALEYANPKEYSVMRWIASMGEVDTVPYVP
ncbi:MAG: hypothetical protein KGJ84_12510 [Elusimicrobia bacterium]|nr:hypothetical protein [Elusimicrobiota bacterium]